MSLHDKSRCDDLDNPQLAAERERAAGILESRDITPTAQRVEIARILLARPQHLSAEQVICALKQGELAVSKATVYNTLGLFAAKGLVREVNVDPNKVFYDSNCSDHHHFYDVDSCTLTDIDARKIAIDGLPDVPRGKVVDRVDVIVRVRSRSD
ncbi:MAG: transcriptional repressor [Gammaproteobacteria bacterium]|jgi:Fur family iron response transcriptional regulator|nr:transcriptional repressor [Gammaproteobacteria bacterium]